MNTSIGNNIKVARKKIGMTQEELACQLGVTAQAVSRWESEVGMPDISMIIPLAQTLSVSTDTLFGLTEHTYNDLRYMEIRETVEKRCSHDHDPENAFWAVQYLREETQKNPADYAILCLYVGRCAGLSQYVDMNGLYTEEWPEIRNDAIRKALQIIRYSNNTDMIEKTHYALAWIYIHEKDYASAREHINTLPSVSSNRLQETILGELAFFENGMDANREVNRTNLQYFISALNKEFTYSMTNRYWWGTPEETIEFGNWVLAVMDTFSQNPDMISSCRGYANVCYEYLSAAYLKLGDYDNSAKTFKMLQAVMEEHYKHYQCILADEDESKKYSADDLRQMSNFTPDFIRAKEDEIFTHLKNWHGEDAFEQFKNRL